MVRAGKNVIAIVATPVQSTSPANDAASNGASGKLLLVNSPRQWKRSLFNGLAQVIVESTSQPGTIVVTAKSKGLIDGVARIETQSSPPGPAVASNLKTEESANAAQ
jgi:beta-galactosidase